MARAVCYFATFLCVSLVKWLDLWVRLMPLEQSFNEPSIFGTLRRVPRGHKVPLILAAGIDKNAKQNPKWTSIRLDALERDSFETTSTKSEKESRGWWNAISPPQIIANEVKLDGKFHFACGYFHFSMPFSSGKTLECWGFLRVCINKRIYSLLRRKGITSAATNLWGQEKYAFWQINLPRRLSQCSALLPGQFGHIPRATQKYDVRLTESGVRVCCKLFIRDPLSSLLGNALHYSMRLFSARGQTLYVYASEQN